LGVGITSGATERLAKAEADAAAEKDPVKKAELLKAAQAIGQEALGANNAYRSLTSYTKQGGTFTVFALPAAHN
jgi:hypothetical protein